MNLYNLRLLAPNHFAMAKFDSDFNVAAIYNLAPKGTGYSCDCPANNRSIITKLCKHRRMLPLMLGAVNTDRFYNPETGTWCQPLAPTSAEAQDLAAFKEAEGLAGPQAVEVVGEASEEPENEFEIEPSIFQKSEQPAGALVVSIQQAQPEVVEQPQPPLATRAAAPTIRRR